MAQDPKSPLFPLIDAFAGEFGELSNKLAPMIEGLIDRGVPVRTAVNQAFNALGVSQFIRDSILEKIVTASAIGYGVKVVADPKSIQRTFLNTTWPGRNLNLAETIAKAEYKEIIADTITGEFKKKTSFTKLAKSLTDKDIIKGELPEHLKHLYSKAHTPELRQAVRVSRRQIERLAQNGAPNTRLKTQYGKLVDTIEKGSEQQFKKAMNNAIREKARYNAERIARTEMARAYGVSNDLRNLDDDDVIGVRFSLSSRHPERDICDLRASADLYGMGRGVYPKNLRPRYPFHPHCLCVRSQVFVGEAQVGKFSQKAGDRYLKSQSEKDQNLLLGVQGRKDWVKGAKWESKVRGYEGAEKITKGGLKKEFFTKS